MPVAAGGIDDVTTGEAKPGFASGEVYADGAFLGRYGLDGYVLGHFFTSLGFFGG
jgi:hypothetical protein